MKEITKFRAWDGLNKVFTYWTMNDLCTWDSKDEKPSALDGWQLCTGLKDKNGKEIYEGDIIEYDYDDYHDPFGTNYPHNKIERSVVRFDNFSDFPDYPYSKCEVVGNIYENPILNN